MARNPYVMVIGPPSSQRDQLKTLICGQGYRARAYEPLSDTQLQNRHARPGVVIIMSLDPAAIDEIQRYRGVWPRTPMVALDLSPGLTLTVELLEAGVDDVLGPEAGAALLAARLRALRRRYSMGVVPSHKIPLIAGDLILDLRAHQVWVRGREVLLSPTEFRILRKLSMHLGRVVPHQDISHAVWGDQRRETTAALRVYIRHIRRKSQVAGEAIEIVSRPGIGYMLAAPS